MSDRAVPPRSDFDVLVRVAIAFTGFVVASCAREFPETSASSSAAVMADRPAAAPWASDSTPPDIGCPDPSSYFIEITGDAGTTTLRSSCANATGDFGAVGAVGGPFSEYSKFARNQVLLEACSDRSKDAAKISLVFGAGTLYYRDALGTVYLSYGQSFGSLPLQIGPIGGPIEGTYTAALFTAGPDGNGSTRGPMISGSFRVCHLQDVDLTPVN